jgi:hypothetical protein
MRIVGGGEYGQFYKTSVSQLWIALTESYKCSSRVKYTWNRLTMSLNSFDESCNII